MCLRNNSLKLATIISASMILAVGGCGGQQVTSDEVFMIPPVGERHKGKATDRDPVADLTDPAKLMEESQTPEEISDAGQTEPTNTDKPDQEASALASAEDSLDDASAQQIALRWAGVVLIRAKQMVDGSDEVDQIVSTAMQNTGQFRLRLMRELNADGRSATDSLVFANRIESSIRATAREFVMRAKTLRDRPTPAPEQHPEPDTDNDRAIIA